jgi:glutamyl-tRNA synthetase
MQIKDLILKYALQNAIKHEGKAQIGAVIAKVLGKKPELRTSRDKIKELAKKSAEVIADVNKLSLQEQSSKLKSIAPELLEKKEEKEKGLPELPKAKPHKVVVRFSPFPSGPLHIGNARTAILNDEYAKKYRGRLLLIMDDTIGSEEKHIEPEAYRLIEEGLKWLGINFEPEIIYKSDRLDIYYEYATKLIKKDKAYVCFCSAKKLRQNREEQKECECRKHSIKENIKEWQNMLQGKYKEGQATLRIKTSMQHKNPAFRDRVLFRISNRHHPRIGKKQSVWPLLDFSSAIDDKLLGITHILRGKELMIETEMEKLIWEIFNWKQAEIIHHGLLNFKGIKLSKSKSKQEVKSGRYIGWNDPRTWSLQSLKQRGIKPEAIRKFCLGFGLTKNDITAPIEILYSENKKFIESSNRYFFVVNPVRIKIDTAPDMHAELPLHPSHPERGRRKFQTKQEFYISKQDYEYIKRNPASYRLMNLFNFSSSGKEFSYISQQLDETLNAKLIHWLPADSENVKRLIRSEVLMPDGYLATGLCEEAIRNLQEDAIVQFERFGFCRLDRKEEIYKFWFAHK